VSPIPVTSRIDTCLSWRTCSLKAPVFNVCRFEADEVLAVRRIVHPVLQAEWDLR
jgi:hypothetical protein